MSSSTSSTSTFEFVEALNTEDFIAYLNLKKDDLCLREAHINSFAEQEVAGSDFLELTKEALIAFPYKFKDGPANRIMKLITELNNQRSLITIEEIIKDITKDAPKRNKSGSSYELKMPLQQRNFGSAMQKINFTVKSNVSNALGKSNYWCIVSGGAPGIGKTRFGHDLYDHVKNHLDKPKEWSDVHYEYLCIDFGSSHKLDEEDYNLATEVIIGLRIAYSFFIEELYDIKFREFRLRALMYHKDTFNVNSVISSCRRSLKLPEGNQFFLYLHIDEFQFIDDWDKNDKTSPPKELFKHIISDISNYIVPTLTKSLSFSSNFVLLFLSGTAPYTVSAQKGASKISFEFVECPLLNNASIIRIIDHFAEKYKAPTCLIPKSNNLQVYKWKLCAPFLQLLMDTGGLPRALEQVLIRCLWLDYKGTFFHDLESQHFNTIFEKVKCELEKKYNIMYYVRENEDLALEILYNCIEGVIVTAHTCLNGNVKVKDLERDGRVVLSEVEKGFGKFLMHMPFIFVCIYNDVLKIVDTEIADQIFRVNNHHVYWQEWELFVLHHEAFRTNLAIRMGITGMTLEKLYPGACGIEYYKNLYVDLKKLSVCEANEQFPKKKELTDKYNNNKIDFESGDVVVLNGASAEFADIILIRKNGAKYLFMIQCKWDYGSKAMEKEVEEENMKNLDNLIDKLKEMYDSYELITIIYTTQPYKGLQAKTGLLIISKDNFKQHLGPVFASRAIFSFTQVTNPNFWDKRRLKNLYDVGDVRINDVINKRPYINEDHFYKENKFIKKRQKLNFFPFDVPETNPYAPF